MACTGLCRLVGRSYSSASRISENLNSRCGFVSCMHRRPSVSDLVACAGKGGRTHHVAAGVNQLVAIQHEPPLPPIMPLRPALHQISGQHDLRRVFWRAQHPCRGRRRRHNHRTALRRRGVRAPPDDRRAILRVGRGYVLHERGAGCGGRRHRRRRRM